MAFSNLLFYITPPLAGGIIGYFTNDLAIKMLFRPYRALYIGGKKLPFTPGLIPRNQERLARNVSKTIMQSLLTPEELQKLARRLLERERVEAGILWLLQMAIDQIKDDRDQKTTRILAGILKDLLGESLPRLLKVLARREDFLEAQIDQIFDQILLEFQLTDVQASRLADWLLQVVLPPDTIRLAIVDFLTDRTIQTIDESFRERTSGTYWVVANLFGLRNSLTRLRTYCLDEKDATNARIRELTQDLQLRDRIRRIVQNVSLQNLPIGTVRQLRKTTGDAVRQYIRTSGGDLLEGFSKTLDWDKIARLLLNRLSNSQVMNSSLEVVSKELALLLERYLERDLEQLVAQAIPILSIDQVIIDRIKSTSPADLENAIEGIVKNELQAIVTLGGILGFTVGLLQTCLLLISGR
ncbi:hypothetical protein Riv7116_5406 [Rivularia sp. PCC 7116]|uniref:DUF445 domain-containing protein n=1 Tax=Rivularia sp. PCC 7116 TaxID=373994 RepID=UPI00029F2E3E|nr:DUF445 family protein [Rivularia sp. PCC 7116]AFY57783.1 hypothetical protein Riv7116_5406 [Rivularia sp. PCC 7116]